MKSKLLVLAIVAIALISFMGCAPIIDPTPPAETQAEQLARIETDGSLKTFLLAVAAEAAPNYDPVSGTVIMLTTVAKPDATLVLPSAVFVFYNHNNGVYEVWASPATGQFNDYPEYLPSTAADMLNIHFYACYSVTGSTLSNATMSRDIPVAGGDSGYVLPDLTFSPADL